MKTKQILKRDFMGGIVSQDHQNGYFCVNDLTSIANKYRKNQGIPEAKFEKYQKAKKSQEFFYALMKQEDEADIIRASRGRNSKTWVHPLVFFDYAMWLSPDFKIKVYEWLYDNLTVFRDESGDSYKSMSSAIKGSIDPSKVALGIQIVARNIKRHLQQNNDWNKTSAENLRTRDLIHKNIIMLLKAGVDINTAQKVAFEQEGVING